MSGIAGRSGRPLSADGAYARLHGVTKREVKRLGGCIALEQLSQNSPSTWNYYITELRKNRKAHPKSS